MFSIRQKREDTLEKTAKFLLILIVGYAVQIMGLFGRKLSIEQQPANCVALGNVWAMD